MISNYIDYKYLLSTRPSQDLNPQPLDWRSISHTAKTSYKPFGRINPLIKWRRNGKNGASNKIYDDEKRNDASI